MRIRGMALVALALVAGCSKPESSGGAKKGTVVVTGMANQSGSGGAQKTGSTITTGRAQIAAIAPGDPSKLVLTVFKTELFDGTAWTTIFDSAAGVPVDLVSNPGSAFGQGTVPAGTYGQVRFTVANTAKFSAGALDTCSAATDASFLINAKPGAPALHELNFATAALGGSGSWTANGSADYPILISAPIEVRDAATTRVTLQFDTTGTVSCTLDGLAIPDAPQMHTYSVVVPKVQSFAGGEYWIAHYNMTGDLTGTALDLSTAQLRADHRRKAGFNLGWGMKAKFYPPTEDGAGLLKLSGGIAENRRRVDETGCGTECGYSAPSGGDQILIYYIDADRRVSFGMPDGPRFVGGFSDDLNTFVGATIEGDRGSADLLFALKASPAQELTGKYAWTSMNTTLGYPSGSQVANFLYTNWSFGWAKLDATSSPDLGQYISDYEFSNPAAVFGSGFSWSAGMKPVVGDFFPQKVVLDSTGVGSLVLGGGVGTPQCTVGTPDGRVMLTVGDTTASNVSGNADAKYDQDLALLLKQASPGSQSLATIAGRWTFATRINSFVGGDDAVAFRGVEYGTITAAVNGAAAFEAVMVDDAGNVGSGSGVGTIRVQKACIGRVGGAGEGGDALAWNDTTCAADGGEVLDVAVISSSESGSEKDVAWFIVDETASVGAIVSPDGYDPATSANGPTMIGYMVRASR